MNALERPEQARAQTTLYHGTCASNLERIKRFGLLPRHQSGARGNFAHTVQSNPDAVYLTDAYAWHFAGIAGWERGLILEINAGRLLPPFLCPDEDFLEQATRGAEPSATNGFAPREWSMKKRTLHYRKLARANADLAQQSLSGMGTAAYYAPIPWRWVTRYVIIDWEELSPVLCVMAADSSVSVVNHRFLADRHRALTRWFFGDPVSAEELTLIPDEKYVERMREEMRNRSGITVHYL